jgi:hypothetical protein
LREQIKHNNIARKLGSFAVPKIYRAAISAVSLCAFTLASSGAYAQRRFRERVEFLSSKMTTIRGEIIETRDRISPNPVRGMVWRRTFTITLGGENNIRETWSSERTDGGAGSGDEHENQSGIRGALGMDSQNMGWHVLGENQLQRVVKRGNSLVMMTITIGGGGACAVTRKWLKQVGQEEQTSGETEHYSPWRVLSGQCTAAST